MLRTRIASLFTLAPVVIFIIIFCSITQFTVFLLIICLIGALEWGRLMRFSKYMQYGWIFTIGLLCSVIAVIQNSLYITHWNSILFFNAIITIIWWILMLLLVLSYPYSAVFWKDSNTLRFCFGIFMISSFFYWVLILRKCSFIISSMSGEWWLLYILMLIWINDSSAYIIGQMIGKYKLLQCVSPGKTWEGCIGGLLISTIVSWLLIQYIVVDINNINTIVIFIFCIGAILCAVVGDLTESMFKRESKIKDTNNLIPGHGGILDRIDSLLSSIPIFTILMLFYHIYIIDSGNF